MPATFVLVALLFAAQGGDRLASVQVQGNQLTSDAEILQLAGVEIGMPVEADVAEKTAARLRDSGRFSGVEVLRRFASISDPTQIALVILIDEGPLTLAFGDKEGAHIERRRGGPTLMYWPILDYEDGYGFTYGVRTTWLKPLGENTRLMFPASWGGRKTIAAQLEKDFVRAPVSRVQVGASFLRREHLYFNEDDDRTRVWGRAERAFGGPFRIGATLSTESVALMDTDDRMNRFGADATFDTRHDPFLARNAVVGQLSWDRLSFDSASPAQRVAMSATGYVGLFGQLILIAKAQRQDSNQPLPDYERPLLGGVANLRGFGAGSEIGDTLTAASLELRLPLTSPLNVGKLGVSAFADTGTIYDKGEKLLNQPWKRGYGGGFWVSAAVFRLNLYVAHGVGGSTRVQAESTVLF